MRLVAGVKDSRNVFRDSNYHIQSQQRHADYGIIKWKVPQTWDNLVEDVSNTYMTGHRVRSGSIPMDKDLTYTKESKHGKGKADSGTMTKWLSGANAALQVGQLVVTADPAQCQHQ